MRDSRVATLALAARHDIALPMHNYDDLAAQFHDRPRLATLTADMRATRHHFAFDTHADAPIAFFRRVIA